MTGKVSIKKVMARFPVLIALILCLLASTAPALDQSQDSTVVNSLDFSSAEDRVTERERKYDIALQETGCDCGKHSEGCRLENGTKICTCEYKYRQVNEICEAYCEEDWVCRNGASCVNETCQCLPHTSGDFCETIDQCDGELGPIICGDPDKVYCDYDEKTHKTKCSCRIMKFIYYPKIRDCIECDCGDYGSCSLIDGKKKCKCNEGAAIKQVNFWGDIVDRCVVCNCGNNSDGCSFDGLYTKVCQCKKGYAQQPDLYGDACNECNCGPNGRCYFKGWYQYCDCEKGYATFLTKDKKKLTCEACDCGKNGVCSFKEEVKQCECNPGYALRDGICTACQCYVEDETAPCVFTNKIQTCLCPDGYEATKFICKDINECLNSSHSCPPDTTDCFNTRGSYECICKEGFAPITPAYNPKKDGCQDINECENENLCPRNHTICENFPGSYKCTCESGYKPAAPYHFPALGGCVKVETKTDEPSSPWKILLIVLGTIFFCCILGLVAVKYVQHRAARNSPLRTDSSMYSMRSS